MAKTKHPRAKANVPLFRGDDAQSVALPTPTSTRSLVDHILYLGGIGRATPWTSTTEDPGNARHFAGKHGRVWQTDASAAKAQQATVVSHKELQDLLKGFGKGKAKWNDAIEVAQARAYVVQWQEHLLGWHGHPSIAAAILATFK